MLIKSLEQQDRALNVVWDDGVSQTLPYIWLRDNDPTELHPHTKERTFDLTSVDLNIKPVEVNSIQSELHIRWPQRDNDAIYSADWLRQHQLGSNTSDPARIQRQSWLGNEMTDIPRFSATACESPAGFIEALTTLKRSGLVLITELADDPDAGAQFGERIGFKRESNFGVMFDVISKPDPNNLAYTSLALPLHTDLPNQEFVPGFQFLHCYKNGATGGASVFADGMAIVEAFAKRNPAGYELLSNTDVPWRFHDESCDVRRHRPIIGIDKQGNFENFTFNAHLADVIDLPESQVYAFYAAYQDLMNLVREPEFRVAYPLQPGEMVIFDNLRVMHGRDAFDPESGQRHLRGYYIEHNEIDSRIRVLAKALNS